MKEDKNGKKAEYYATAVHRGKYDTISPDRDSGLPPGHHAPKGTLPALIAADAMTSGEDFRNDLPEIHLEAFLSGHFHTM